MENDQSKIHKVTKAAKELYYILDGIRIFGKTHYNDKNRINELLKVIKDYTKSL